MSEYDLVIRNGVVIDGTGAHRYEADVGIRGGRIVALGRVGSSAAEVIDAHGHIVCPGFIDGHTHLDAQVFWDPLATPSCWHGVTTAIMGNCGFTLAPARADARGLVLANLERAEDIPKEALEQGVRWSWEHFADYLDALDRLPLGINVGVYVGHSALRTFVMGERAFTEEAVPDDLAAMTDELSHALRNGAIGLSSSRSSNHMTADGRPVASRIAAWDEVVSLVTAMKGADGAVFEISNESVVTDEYRSRLKHLAVTSDIPITFGVTSFGDPRRYLDLLDLLDETHAAGGRMFGQSTGRESSALFSFKTWLPFDRLPEWSQVRKLPLDEQARRLRDPSTKARLVEEASTASYALGAGPARAPDYESIRVLRDMIRANESVATLASRRGVHPAQAIIDVGLETQFEQFFMQISGNANPAEVEQILRHPHTVMTFSDAGAHVSQLINASLQTHLLALWVRERERLTLEEAVRMITSVPARAWGLAGRGELRLGAVADVNVFDPATIAPELPRVVDDLPGGGRRLTQGAVGILATLVNGEVTAREGRHTGALPGQLIRRGR